MILVTGGLGYIGSHICFRLIEERCDVLCISRTDNKEVREKLTSLAEENRVKFEYLDFNLEDTCADLYSKLKDYDITDIIHLAADKSVGESVNNPLKYYSNNVQSLINILKVPYKNKIKNILFSSSACVYGNTNKELKETSKIGPINPYGQTKVICEKVLEDFSKINPDINIVSLRYSNPIGTVCKEFIEAESNNIMPHIIRAKKESSHITIFGKDYDTKDGTCLRDYIHILDLVDAHIKILSNQIQKGYEVYNVSTGKTTSTLELVTMSGQRYTFGERRAGDAESICLSPEKIYRDYNWQARRAVKEALESVLKWV